MKSYKPSSKIGIIFGILLLIPMCILCASLFWRAITDIPLIAPLIIAVGFTTFIGYCTFIAAKIEYSLFDDKLVINYGLNKKMLDIKSIDSAEISDAIKTPLNVGGTNWPGLHFGACNIDGKKNVTLYATRMNDIVFIHHKWEIIGISPDDPQQFIKDLEELKVKVGRDS